MTAEVQISFVRGGFAGQWLTMVLTKSTQQNCTSVLYLTDLSRCGAFLCAWAILASANARVP